MKARILVLDIVDAEDDTHQAVAHAIRTWSPGDEEFLAAWQEEAVEDAGRVWGDYAQAHGFLDVTIPDDVVAQVLRRHADAGVVAAEPVELAAEVK